MLIKPTVKGQNNGAQGRNRTGTEFNLRRILSPVRLPISPPGQMTLLMYTINTFEIQKV